MLLRTALLFALLPLTSVACRTTSADNTSEAKIVNGTLITDANDPIVRSTVALLDANDFQYCSGVIVDNGLVLTADHCIALSLTQINSGGMKVGFGPGPTYSVVRNVVKVIHPKIFGIGSYSAELGNSYFSSHPEHVAQYTDLSTKQTAGTLTTAEKAQLANLSADLLAAIGPMLASPPKPLDDIALLKFDGDTPLGFVDVNIASNDEIQAANGWSRVAGYGITSDTDQSHGVLKWAWMHIGSFNAPSQEVLLTPYNGTNTCHGDSGGPSYIQTPQGVLRLLALDSRSPNGSCMTDGSIETDAIAHSPWINCAAQLFAGVIGNDCAAFQNKTEVLIPPLPGPAVTTDGVCLSLLEQLQLLSYALRVQQGTTPLNATETEDYNQLTARFQSIGACPTANQQSLSTPH